MTEQPIGKPLWPRLHPLSPRKRPHVRLPARGIPPANDSSALLLDPLKHPVFPISKHRSHSRSDEGSVELRGETVQVGVAYAAASVSEYVVCTQTGRL